MAKSFNQLRAKMSPESRKRAEAKTAAILRSLPLHELRAARKVTQEQLAETLNLKQAAISRMERRTDVYISTLRRYIEAMGGELVISARFPDGEVEVRQFGDIEE
jgi:DNA-binding XRE family transcriptional regulator